MDDEEIKERVDTVKDAVILSNTRINYLLQLNDLIKSKNRQIMVFQGFYSMVIRDFNRSLLLDLRGLAENRQDTHNIRTLTILLNEWAEENCDTATQAELNKLTTELESALTDNTVKAAIILASTQAAHNSLKKPTKKQVVTYEHARDWLKHVGDTLNKISGLLWNAGTVMEIPDSTDESYRKELEHIERAELAGTHLLRIDEDHEAVKYADRLLQRKAERNNNK